MAIHLEGRHFLKELDFTAEEFRGLIDLAAELKAAKKAGTEVQRLRGKNIALIFEKASTRTRCAFEVAAADQGAATTYIDPAGSHIGKKESAKDTARVLGRMFDGIEFRGTPRRRSRSWPRTPVCPSSTASRTTGTPRRCSPTCSP